MTTRWMTTGLAVMLLMSGCALLSKSASVKLRYFAPVEVVAAPAAVPAASRLRVGRVEAAAHLRDWLAFRASAAEVGFYNTLRWAEPPEAYLRRGLSGELFVRRGLREIVSGIAPTLDVTLAAFEEVRGATLIARVVLRWRLRGDREVLQQRAVTIDRPIAGPVGDGAAIAAALGVALDAAMRELGDDVVVALGPTSPP